MATFSPDDFDREVRGLRNSTNSLRDALKFNPDQEAEKFSLEKSTGLAPELIDFDREEARRMERLRIIDPPKLPPKTAEWLRKPKNAAVASDDVETLSSIEQHLQAYQDQRGYWNNQGRGFVNTMSSVGTEALSFTAWAAEQVSKIVTKPIDATAQMITGESAGAEQWAMGVRDYGRRSMDQAQAASERHYDFEQRADIQKVIDNPTPANIGQFIAESGPNQIPYMIAAGISYPLIVATVGNMVAKERVINDRLAPGTLPDDRQMAIGGAAAGLTGVLDRFSLGKLWRSGAKPAGGFIPYALKQVPGAMAWEGGTEFVQEGMEYLAGSIGTEKGASAGEWFKQSLAGGLSGVGMGGTVRAGTVRSEYNQRIMRESIQETYRELQSQEAQDWLDGTVTLAQSSKTNQRAGEQFEDFLGRVSPSTTVYLKADIASQLEEAPDYVTEKLDGTGADIAIPLRKFIADFARDPEKLNFVRPHVTLNENLLTLSELENAPGRDAIQRMVEQSEREQETDNGIAAIYEKVKDQLVSTRRQGEQTARVSAQIYPAVIKATQERLRAEMGIDVSAEELFKMMGLRTVGPGTIPAGEQLSQADDDMQESLSGYALEEFEYLLGRDLDGEESTPEAALDDLVNTIDDRREDFSPAEVKQVLDLAISRGMYTEISAEELKDTQVFGGGKKYDLAHRGKKYKFVKNLSQGEGSDIFAQQNFGDTTTTKTGRDEAGNAVEVTEKIQDVWDYHQNRKEMLEKLRKCANV